MPRHNSATPQEILRLAAARINAGQHATALALCDEALAAIPDDVSGLVNRGLALTGLGDAAAARRSFNRAINEDPTVGSAWNGLGMALFDLGEPAKAAEAFRTASGLMADTAEARYHRGMALLSMGDFAAGWAEYDHRVAMPSMKLRRYDAPRWVGEPLDGKRLLVVAEQGYGDMIQFARLLPRAAACGGPVIFEAPAELLPVFAPLSASATLRAMENGPVPGAAFDCHTHLMSMPAALSLTEDSIPADIPNIAAPADRITHWRDAMAGDGLKLGLCWAGRPSHPQDMQRSMDCRHLAPLAAMPGLRLFSLQKGLEKFPMAMEIRDRLADDFSRLPEDFAETAAIVANLDLLITVDTSLAHLAGALRVRVWVVLPFAADWRWMRDRSDTPWYPAMRLFRQEKTGDWDGVMARVMPALADYPS